MAPSGRVSEEEERAPGKAGHWGVWHSQERPLPLSQAQASLRLPGGSEAGAGQALSRLTAPRCARLPPERGLPGLARLWRGTQLTSWTPEVGQLTSWGRAWPPLVGAVLGEPMLTLCRNSLTANGQKGLPGS